MKATTTIAITLAAIAGFAGQAFGQDDDQTHVYGIYYYCDASKQERADEIIATVAKPVYDAALKSGDIKGWGWLVHHTGGQWRRVLYHSAGSMSTLLSSQDEIIEQMEANDADAMTEFDGICGAHDDYIWRGVNGSGGGLLTQERGRVGFSAYFVCDSREPVADEIVETVFAPIYDAQVESGKLASWGWSEHIVGGEFRRLATMTSADWPTLFAAREAIIDAAGDSELATQFGEICDSHVDYMWDIQIEAP